MISCSSDISEMRTTDGPLLKQDHNILPVRFPGAGLPGRLVKWPPNMPSPCCPESMMLEHAVELFSSMFMGGPERCTAMWHQLLTRHSMTARLRRYGHVPDFPCDDHYHSDLAP